MDKAGNFNYISSPLFLIKDKEKVSILTSVLRGSCFGRVLGGRQYSVMVPRTESGARLLDLNPFATA